MVEKPISGDEEQRRAQTRAARFQSGLPPEDDQEPNTEPGPARPVTSETEGEKDDAA